ncbi:multicopper oxidase family protein [Streptomyces sp. SL13]|uniref:Multicopper oxidase family protein n=1 Tax=Streptantibioticus silvisoli TaxID=2705255 RepID=A0AA90KEV3_9ACTN|nr:multicopper oxidase family protein [Streptantibioticus silvisoli]MDI5968234.1 multicopper oxidase family protein [Streptantibioticus silvisoli]
MRSLRRRSVLSAGLAAAGGGLLGACGPALGSGRNAPPPPGYVRPDGPQVLAAERERGGTGPVTKVELAALAALVDLGGPTVPTWTYGGQVPGRCVRVKAGGTLELTLTNHLPQPTTMHWHGCVIRNDMDGVPGLTQDPITPGSEFMYRFKLERPGTYWFHPHTGVQLDRGLYAPLIVDDPREPLRYDHEWIVVLDDWVDGVAGSTPDIVLAQLAQDDEFGPRRGRRDGGRDGDRDDGMGDMGGMGAPTADPSVGPDRRFGRGGSDLLGGHPGDVAYPYYLINGRVASAPETFRARPGDRVRLRIINAGGDTAFRVALGGHRMTVTHTDGQPVVHHDTDALLLGMGERYDVLVTVGDGVFPLVALAEGKDATAMAVLRTSASGAVPAAGTRPSELDGMPLSAHRLTADESVALEPRPVDTTVPLRLTRNMPAYDWGFNRRDYSPSERMPVSRGQRVRLSFVNETRMWHPVHLHGHSFALPDGGPMKDTVIVLPRRSLDVEMDADNPGLWMLHCHNIYHAESGMMTVLGYRS